jgi:hypothetical protein
MPHPNRQLSHDRHDGFLATLFAIAFDSLPLLPDIGVQANRCPRRLAQDLSHTAWTLPRDPALAIVCLARLVGRGNHAQIRGDLPPIGKP